MAKEAGDEGWWGTWAEVSFNVTRTTPYITMPREVARLAMVSVCDKPIPLNNQFYEYLQFGNGRLPKMSSVSDSYPLTQLMTRNNAVTFYSLLGTPQTIRIYATDAADVTGISRVLIQGKDSVGNTIYSQDGLNRVDGIFVTLEAPFVDTPYTFSQITGIQKDITQGQVQFFQVDPTTGVQEALHTMEPSEQTAMYRRYYFADLPCNCCYDPSSTSTTVQVTAIVKLELLPVKTDTDYTLFTGTGGKEAIINEAEAIRFEGMDSVRAAAMADRKHKQAIGLLNGQLCHYLGKDSPAVSFAPFGTARLERQRIGTMI